MPFTATLTKDVTATVPSAAGRATGEAIITPIPAVTAVPIVVTAPEMVAPAVPTTPANVSVPVRISSGYIA